MAAKEHSVLRVTASLFPAPAGLRTTEARFDEDIAAVLLIFGLNMWAQQSSPSALYAPEPGARVREEFLKAYNAKDVDAVVAQS
jgi:hypothetical protein